MSPATTTDAWQLFLKLLNERLPLLVRDGDQDVRERVAFARAAAPAGRDAGSRHVRIVTYRGRELTYEGVTSVQMDVTRRDDQGVPLEYEVTLRDACGEHRLHFLA